MNILPCFTIQIIPIQIPLSLDQELNQFIWLGKGPPSEALPYAYPNAKEVYYYACHLVRITDLFLNENIKTWVKIEQS